MRKILYPKLAGENIRKNHKAYIPYIFTCILAVAMFYMLNAIAMNSGINEFPGAATLKILLNMAVGITGIFATVFLFYTNSFLIKRRKKEIGIYQVLGMDKLNLTKMMIWETIYTASVGIAGGLLIGLLIGRLMFLVFLKIIHFKVLISFTIEPVAALHSLLLFGMVFLATLVWNLFQVRKVSPVELLQGGQKGEKEPKANKLIAFAGIFLLGAGYWIAQTTQSPLAAIGRFFVAVLLVIGGTYALFISGSIALLKLLRKNKRFYYQTRHFTSVSGLIYRMKQNAAGLANICILSTVVLVLISMTLSLYLGMDDIMKTRFPMDFSVRVYGTEHVKEEVFEKIIQEEAKKYSVEIQDKTEYVLGNLSGVLKGQKLIIENASADAEDYRQICMIPLAEYNSMTGEKASLAPDEVFVYFPSEEYHADTIQVGEYSYQIKENLKEFILEDHNYSYVVKNVYLILPDESQITQIMQNYGPDDAKTMTYELKFNLKGNETDREEAMAALKNRLEETGAETIRVEYRELFQQEFYGLYGGFLFLGIFVGALFLMATVLIIYYKQISEGYDDRERYQIMQKVGMSEKEVKNSIRSQVLTVFFIPLIMSLIHVGAAFKVMVKLLAVLNLVNVRLFLACTAGTAVIFVLFYTVVFSITSREYYRIIR